MIDHDRLFKELLSNFFAEFIELFFPDVNANWDRDSLEFLPQEVFTDVTEGERKIVDLVVRAAFRNQDALFIIHTEHQSYAETDFNERMFHYFARLHEKYALPIYPIVIFSYDAPQRPETNSYRVAFSGWTVLEFHYRVIQLNRLNWEDFVNQRNPVASALMSKMRKLPQQRPTVKLVSLQLLSTLGLNPAQVQLISGFIDTYLDLNTQEEAVFQEQLARIEPRQQEEVMEIVTSWMRKGIERGIQQGELALVMRQLNRRLGAVSPQLHERIQRLSAVELEDLGEALLDFTNTADLETWLGDR
ncbi:MAG: DUF4351 domain-containing protein [Stigonema ocellatum SAG 48.90 = DSM 106950]|nr:DUF4351 domain-containing protein [Stigonema ocellatum SAG 48.90 = DSM 106950]